MHGRTFLLRVPCSRWIVVSRHQRFPDRDCATALSSVSRYVDVGGPHFRVVRLLFGLEINLSPQNFARVRFVRPREARSNGSTPSVTTYWMDGGYKQGMAEQGARKQTVIGRIAALLSANGDPRSNAPHHLLGNLSAGAEVGVIRSGEAFARCTGPRWTYSTALP